MNYSVLCFYKERNSGKYVIFTRESRIKKARESGQLLVYSPTLRNLAALPCEDNEENVEPEPYEHALTHADAQRDDSEMDEAIKSPYNMEVEVCGHESTKSQVSFVTAQSDLHNQEIKMELQNLRETINKLVDRRSTQDESKQHHISLEAHMIRTEKVLLENSKLEHDAESLLLALKETQVKASEEKERLQAELDQMASERKSASEEAQRHAEDLERVKKDMEDITKENHLEKQKLLTQIQGLHAELDDVRRRLLESRDMLEALNNELDEERKSIVEEREELRRSGSILESEIEQLNKANDVLKCTILAYEQKVATLENSLLPESEDQLYKALEKLKQFEENETILKEGMIEYEKRVKRLTEELSVLQEEKEQERQHFQKLNEESSYAYEQMKTDLQEKDTLIASLRIEMESLAAESLTLRDTTEELKTLRANMDGQTSQLENMLEDTTFQLNQVTKEKHLLEEKLSAIVDDVKENASFKEEILAQSLETSAANKRLQERIEQLENELQVSRSECDDAKRRVETFNERESELYKKLQESDRVRRSLHNRVMQLSGNIRVYVRVRPELPGERQTLLKSSIVSQAEGNKKRKHTEIEEECPFHFPGTGGQESTEKSQFGADDPTKNLLEVIEPKKDRGGLSERRKKWVFGFDNVFNPSHGQGDIWEATEPLVQSAIDGYNVTVFAYGQTGSGMYDREIPTPSLVNWLTHF